MRRPDGLSTSNLAPDGRPGSRDTWILVAILALASALRFAGLPGRGEWDDDQGLQLLALSQWVRDGQVPLLGPLSSSQTVHHGVGYYWLLAPGAFLTDTHPVAAVVTLALLGVVGVGATWWLARTVGGPVAGHVGGLLMAVSPSAITSSTFVWNPNIVGPGAALAAAAAWHAWRTRRARWWLVAALGTVLMVHGHVLAVLGAVPLLALLIADVRRRTRSEWPAMLYPVAGAVAIVAAGYAPLLISELRTGFAESRAVGDYLTQPGGDDHGSVLDAPTIAWRILAWPLSGTAPSAPLLGVASAVLTAAALVVVASLKGERSCGVSRQFGRWAVVTVLATTVALAFLAPGLATYFAGWPSDQYHAWLAPILLAVLGVAAGQLGRGAAATGVAACLAVSLVAMPPLRSPDGGWPKAADTAARIVALTGGKPVAVVGVAKNAAAITFPLSRARATLQGPATADYLVVTCDPLYERTVGLPCGGRAESAIASQLGFGKSVAQFTDSPRRVVCVFSRS